MDTTDPQTGFLLHRTVVLVGMMGSGKTAIGRALAARLDVAFRDSDSAIEEAAQRSIAEIFARDGEAFFREREAEVIERLLGQSPGILSTGGGAFMNPMVRQIIAEAGTTVWLDVDLATLWERVRHKDTRPLLRTADPQATLTVLYHDRTPTYQLADLRTVITAEISIEETTELVLQTLLTDPRTLETTP